MPAKLQAVCFHSLKCIQIQGLTEVFPGNININSKGQFKIKFVEEDHPDRLKNGVVMKGSVEYNKAQNHKICFTHIEGILEGKKIERPVWKKLKQKFVPVDAEWLNAQQMNPFIRQACQHKTNRQSITDYSASYIEMKRCFYRNIGHVEIFKKHHEVFGSFLTTDSKSCHGETQLITLDPRKEKKTRPSLLSDTLDRLKKDARKPYIIVNFIDELDPFFHAQLFLMAHMTNILKRNYEAANITIVDVVIRGKEGISYYQEEYRMYSKESPMPRHKSHEPFSMLIFSPHYGMHNNENIRQLFSSCYKTLYFDLFSGCRETDLTPEEKDKRFLKNRDLIMHEMYAAAGSYVPWYYLEVKDLRGDSDEKIQEVTTFLSKDSVVVRVNGNRGNLEIVKNACACSFVAGYPYIAIVWADGDKNEVTIGSGLFSKKESINEGNDLRYAIETLYEFKILDNLPGNQTVENLYSGYDLHVNARFKKRPNTNGFTPGSALSHSRKNEVVVSQE